MKSSQTRTQRRKLYNLPLHRRQKIVSANLSKKLREEFGRRSLTLRVGDQVEIVRGDQKGTKGKVTEVDLKSYSVKVDSIKRRKVDGTEVHSAVNSSNLRIIEPMISDKKRAKIIERSGGKVTVTKEKTEKKTAEKKEAAAVKCQICNEEFNTKKELSNHMGEKHKDYTQ